jgi:predicted metal-dependent phosphoesterase TrpH
MALHYDLHTHSTASDGTLSPAELVTQAAVAGVDVLALTDHDTTAGLAEAAKAAAEKSLKFVPGVEVSVTWEGLTVHLVGLGIQPGHPQLEAGLASIRDFRGHRAQEIGRRLARDAGVKDAYAGACRYAHGELVGRLHFAHFLVEQGKARDADQVFKRFLVRNKPGYVPGQWAKLEDAVGWILAAGGQAVIAHPARYRATRRKLLRLIDDFQQCGGIGLEVVSGSHSKDDTHVMANVARDQGLLASCGSDYHGPVHARVGLGRLEPLPRICTPIWADWPAVAA